MLTINIFCVGKIKEKFFQAAIDEYSKRLSKYCKLNIFELPDEKIPDKINDNISEQIKEKESDNVINHLPKDTYIICLDLKGKELSSEDFSSRIDNISMQTNNISFIICGSLVIHEKLLKISQEKICFSKLTFPHQLIRIFLLEQLFRAFKISNGETYHR